MQFKPHDYPQGATAFIEFHPAATVILEMWLRKTFCTLTAIEHLLRIPQEWGKPDHAENGSDAIPGTTKENRSPKAAVLNPFNCSAMLIAILVWTAACGGR